MRNNTLDLFKAVSIFAVVVIHTHPFGVYGASTRSGMEIFLNQLCRFAVPFFFITTGYFLGKNPHFSKMASLMPKCKRWLTLFFIWCALYIVITLDIEQIVHHGYLHIVYWKIYYCTKNPFTVLFSGTTNHLWYLPSLVTSALFVGYLRQLNRKATLPICAVLYILGVLGGAYKNTILGLPIPFDTKYGPIMGSLFIAIGWQLATQPCVKTPTAFKMVYLGLLLHMLELLLLYTLDETIDLTNVDFLFSTVLFGAGVTLLAFSLPPMPSSFFTSVGQYTLGIYLCHPLFLEMLRPVREWNSTIINTLFVPLLVLGFSIIATQIAYLNQRTRYIIS